MSINNTILILFLLVAILYIGKFILLPFSISLFIFLIIKSLSNKFSSTVKDYLKIQVNKIFALMVILVILFAFLYFFWVILEYNINSVRQNSTIYQNNFYKVLNLVSNTSIQKFFSTNEIINSLNFMKLFSQILNNLSSFAGNFSFILLLLIFFIIEEKFFLKKLDLIVSRQNMKIISKINYDIFYYFQIKSLTSFLTGFFTFIVLFFLKSDLAPAFGVLTFILNFIPIIGSLLGILIPFIFSGIQFLSVFEPITTLIALTIIQIYIGNFLEPKLMGNKLNISPVAMILFLSIMGKIWGIAGMFLSVPLLVVILIILRRIKSTKNIAIFLSEKGDD